MQRVDHSEVIGQTYGRLTVAGLGPPHVTKHGRTARYVCTCACGKSNVLVRRAALLNGTTRSCGCLSAERHTSRQGRSTQFRAVSTHGDIRRILHVSNDF